MRKFIVSDLHGDGNVYDSIMAYLENIKTDTNDDITLYINGDLIDRGSESARMLIDVKDRIENNKSFKIVYLAGNHELMMWQTAKKRKNGVWPIFCNWFSNGGDVTAYGLDDLVSKEKQDEIINFISNLRIYHKFYEKLNDKNIVLVHAKCPKKVLYACNLKVKDNHKIENYVWSKKDRYDPFEKIGNKDYFTIIGHSISNSDTGYKYYKDENYMNIDGGCAGYVRGLKGYDHVPLVEIDGWKNRLIILTFNNNNEIICGNYFKNGVSTPIDDLDSYKKYISPNVKIKKLVKDSGGFIHFK